MSSSKDFTIDRILSREVFDSRGNPTVEVELFNQKGASAKAIVPSGASTGANEALELRDKDPKRFSGKGVLQAVENIEQKILPEIKGQDVRNIRALDNTLLASFSYYTGDAENLPQHFGNRPVV
jgi:enolase